MQGVLPISAASEHRLVFHTARDEQMLNTGGQVPVWLMKGHVDPIANQYVPNMQCPL